LLSEKLVYHRRISFAFHGAHDLANEESEHLRLARPVFCDLAWILGQELVHQGLDLRGITDLAQTFLRDDGSRFLTRAKHLRQDPLAGLRGNLAAIYSQKQ